MVKCRPDMSCFDLESNTGVRIRMGAKQEAGRYKAKRIEGFNTKGFTVF
jgi:hypothetical protein